MSDDKDPALSDPKNAEEAALKERLENLRQRLDGPDGDRLADRADPNRAAARKRTTGDVSKALRLSSEFIAGVMVGGALGYGFDQLFNTSPWGLIIFLLLGFAAAVLNVMRSAGFVAENELRLKDTPLSHPNSDDHGDKKGNQ